MRLSKIQFNENNYEVKSMALCLLQKEVKILYLVIKKIK